LVFINNHKQTPPMLSFLINFKNYLLIIMAIVINIKHSF
jgi:hypothetical protein